MILALARWSYSAVYLNHQSTTCGSFDGSRSAFLLDATALHYTLRAFTLHIVSVSLYILSSFPQCARDIQAMFAVNFGRAGASNRRVRNFHSSGSFVLIEGQVNVLYLKHGCTAHSTRNRIQRLP